MYYDLTKKEYKEYEKKFNKTYVGKQYYIGRILSGVIGCIFYGIAGGIVGYNSVDSFTVSLSDIGLLFIGSLCLLESLLWHIQYRKELKEFIIEKNNK